MKQRALSALVLGVAAIVAAAPRAAMAFGTPASAPACVRENSCSFTACYGAPTGAVHYVCDCNTSGAAGLVSAQGQQPVTGCVAGSDSNAGTSPSAPWQSYDKARTAFSSAAAGDQILFCKGGVWDLTSAADNRWSNYNSTASNRAVVGSYSASWATGSEGRPMLMVPLGTKGVSFDHSNGTSVAGYVFAGLSIQGKGQPATPVESSPLCGGSPCPMEAFFVYNGASDILICDVEMGYLGLGIENAGGNNNENNQRIIVRNSIIHDAESQGWLGGGLGNEIRNNYFEHNGWGVGSLDHQAYLTGGAATVNVSIIFSGNELYRGSDNGGGCAADNIVMHGYYVSGTISGNYIHHPSGTSGSGCYGIGINPGYTSTEQFANINITGNVIAEVGGAGINVSACHTCTVTDNVLISSGGTISEGIALTNDGTASGGSDWVNTNVWAYNNTFYLSGNSAIGLSINENEPGGFTGSTGYVSANNVFYATGTGTVSGYQYTLADSAYTYIDHNWFFAPNAAGTHWNSSGSLSLTSWRTHGFDLSSTEGTNPSFVNPRASTSFSGALSDFYITSGSGLKDAGTNTYCPSTDAAGNTRPQGTACDIGALEYLSGTVPGKPALEMFLFVADLEVFPLLRSELAWR